MRSLGVACLIGLLLVASQADAEDRPSACTASSLRVGDCFTVHGRMTSCTGVPNVRIWVIGTKRILGVVDAKGDPAGEHILPERLDRGISVMPPCSKAAFGEFTVCPLTEERPGVMRKVCLESATNLTFRDF